MANERAGHGWAGILLIALLLGGVVSASGQEAGPAPIADNSFLLEEAYNQEPGVVQHISLFTRQEQSWVYSFTQEWPVLVQKHQFSYTIPLMRPDAAAGVGLGDIAVHYRYQIGGMEGDRLAAAPRLTVLLPTGSASRGRGSGEVGYQVNLPVSLAAKRFAAHFNAGATYLPTADPAGSVPRSETAYNLGQSVVWLARPSFNVLTEAVWMRSLNRPEAGPTERETSFLISPGVRGALNFASGLQVVPGAAVAFETVGDADPMLVLYLSFEHPFGNNQGR